MTKASFEVVSVLTFDVEDWYQGFLYRGISGWEKYPSREKEGVERILEILDDFRTKATFFVVGNYAESHPDTVRLIASRGHEVASHGYVHKPIPLLGANGFREDVRRSLEVLQSITKVKVRGYRAASWSLTRECHWALDILAEHGLEYDSSIFPTRLHAYGYPGQRTSPHIVNLLSGRSIYEFPAQVLSFGPLKLPAAGGFYLRALPLFVSRWALSQSVRKNKAGMVYLHAYDFDDKAPVLKTGFAFHIIRYYHLGETERYLKNLLRDFRFSSIGSLLDSWKVAGEPRAPA